MRRFALIVGIGLLLAGCNTIPNLNQRPVAMINWVDLIKLNGTTYIASRTNSGRALEKADLGPELARIQFKVADTISDPNYRIKDGDATLLEVGTPVYQVQGYAPQMRLAAERDGQIMLYEADTNPNAQHGSDLLDLRDKVTSIGINSMEDGITEVAAIKDPQQVAALVEMILAAPVKQNEPPQDDTGPSYFLVFYFRDGTTTSRMYSLGSGELVRGIFLPEEFRKAIETAL